MAVDERPDRPPRQEKELRQWRKNYEQSRKSLLPYGVIGAVITLAGVAVEVWGAGCSWWLWAVMMVIAWHGFVGDLINVLVLRRRIAAAERDRT